MKIFKKNFLIIISFFILLFIVGVSTNDYLKMKTSVERSEAESREFCTNNPYEGKKYEEYCIEVLNKDDLEMDFFTAFSNINSEGLLNVTFILFLFVVVPSLYNTSKYLKNKIIVEDATRMSYKKIKKKYFKEAYKAVMILPLIAIISIIISYVFSSGFDYSYAVRGSTTGWSIVTMSQPLIFIMAYLLNVIFHSILYVNISLIVVRKYHNYFVSVILSFLFFIGIEAFLEIAIWGILINVVLKESFGLIFNIMNFVMFNDGYGILPVVLFSFSMMVISSVVVYFKYRDKEKLIIDCEVND